MRARRWSVMVLLGAGLTGCGKDLPAPPTGGAGDDTSATVDTAPGDSGGDSAEHTGETTADDTAADTAGDTAADTGAFYTSAQVSGVSARLHEDIESLVYVRWEQEAPGAVWVEYSVDDGEWRSTPPIDAEVGSQEHLLLGVPYEHTVAFRVANDFGPDMPPDGPLLSDEGAATTGPVPAGVPLPTVLISDPAAWEPTGEYLYASVASLDFAMWRFIMDRQGRLVWCQANQGTGFGTFYARVSYDGGDLLWDEVDFFGKAGDASVYRMKIDGTLVDAYETRDHHHAFVDLPDGSIVWGAFPMDGSPETLEKRSPDGSQETVWTSDVGWISNSLYWDEASDSFLYSFFTTDTVVAIDHATGAELERWGVEGSWSFDPPESQFYMQHGVEWTPAGTLLLSAHAEEESVEGVAREYAVDREARTLTEVWSFGVGEGIEAPSFGEARRLPGGNTLQNYGTNPRLRETTPDGEVVWDVVWGDDTGRPAELIARSVYLQDLYAFAP